MRYLFAVLLAVSAMPMAVTAAPDKPNFVFFLVDDLGWTDLGCFGLRFDSTKRVWK